MYNNLATQNLKKMLQNIQNKTILSVITLLLMSSTIFAQDEDPGGIGGGDPGTAPISDWIPLMLLVAIGLLFFYTRKKTRITQ